MNASTRSKKNKKICKSSVRQKGGQTPMGPFTIF